MKIFKNFLNRCNHTTLFFIIAVVAFTAQLFLLNKIIIVSYNYTYNDLPFKFYSLAISLADALVLLAVYWLLPQRRKVWIWLVLALMLVYSIVQVLYHPTYHDIMPWSSFTYVQNVGPLLLKSALGEFKAFHLLLFLPVVALLMLFLKWRKRIANETMSGTRRALAAIACVMVYVIIHAGLLFCDFGEIVKQKGSYARRIKNYSVLMANHTRYYLKYGFVAYTTRAAVHTILANRTLSNDERQQVEAYLAVQPHYSDNPYGQPGKNLILIIVESLNAWAVDMKLDGREVTPVLNRLCADSTALVSLSMKTQVKNGHSSDGHFMYNTGLLPLTTESVAMNYGDRDYPALAKALKGYDCFEEVCDPAIVWNQRETYRSYGYDRIYDSEYLLPILEECEWVDDRALFRNAARLISECKKPFFAQLITVSMHGPYNILKKIKPGWISASKSYTDPVRTYLEVTSAFDQELGLFLDKLKELGLYDNSIIVIASDHTERVDDDPRGRAAITGEGDDCVFIALNTGHGGRIQDVIGQIDVYPTILDMMGANAYPWKGLGHSVLRGAIGAAAVSPDEVKGAVPAKEEKRLKDAWEISNLMITRRYFVKE